MEHPTNTSSSPIPSSNPEPPRPSGPSNVIGRVPKLRRHSSGLAFVQLNRRRIYLGAPLGTPEAEAKYHELLARWPRNGRRLPDEAPDDMTVNELIGRYWDYARRYYRKDGRPTSQQGVIRMALRPLLELYGTTEAARFDPRSLKIVREAMIDRGWARTTVNRMVGIVRGVFRWASEEQLVPSGTSAALGDVAPLRKGRSRARETVKVQPVPEGHIEAIRPLVSETVRAIIQLQLHTGGRPGELLAMRPIDLDMSGSAWIYRPGGHKTAHRDRDRTVYLGPRAQGILAAFIASRPVDAPLFTSRPQRGSKCRGPVRGGLERHAVGGTPKKISRQRLLYRRQWVRRRRLCGGNSFKIVSGPALLDRVAAYRPQMTWRPRESRPGAHEHAPHDQCRTLVRRDRDAWTPRRVSRRNHRCQRGLPPGAE